ncbi:MAG TPA: SDR family oxidoreductase [Novosphingobium sp.]|nr:SDR family oxidoreductase [Novosphingobium sp.]HMP57405.1 SDR family oxidoreductase [Novosphingobium sp.]
MDRPLEGKVALVTGAGQGLGRACAIMLASRGARVVVATQTPANGEETVELARKAGGEARCVRTDVSREDDVRAMVGFALDTWGRLDCAVNNAYRNIGPKPLADISLADWQSGLDVNLTGVFLSMKYEIEAMLGQDGGGAIVNIGSGNEHTALPGHSWYLAAKQGIYAMTKVAALDYGRRGLRINAVAPGPMWTPSLRAAAATEPAHAERLSARVPLGRVAEPKEVAEAVCWLCGPAASYVQGITMSVDGGFVLG